MPPGKNRRNGSGPEAVRVGVIGLGYWGPNLVRNLVELEGVEVAHLCDARVETLSRLSRRYPGIRCSTDVESVLNDRSVDAVAIATPVATHHTLALAALKAGKHVFV